VKPPSIDKQIALARWSPLRTPAWRWILALKLATERRRLHRCSDPVVAAAFRFMQATRAAQTCRQHADLARRFPELILAHKIFAAADMTAAEIEARLLANETPAAIARKTSTPEGVVAAFADVFFDVRAAQAATDWLVWQAVGVDSWPLHPDERAIWRFMALAGGPHVLDLLVGDFRGQADPDPPHRHVLAERARLLAREFADSLFNAAPGREILQDGVRLFGHLYADQPQTYQTALLQVQQDFLHLVADQVQHKTTRKRVLARDETERIPGDLNHGHATHDPQHRHGVEGQDHHDDHYAATARR
jgi:hypothetical protein